jgi:F-type H+-transporting ATPase subunit b
MRPRPRIQRAAEILSLALFICLLLPSATRAQDQPTSSPNPNSSARQEKRDSGRGIGSQLAHETREAAGEDDQEQFKRSTSVSWLAGKTGLSLDQAYWLSILLNFAVVAGLLIWLSKKNLPGFFRNRTTSIQKAMQEAQEASEEANRRLADIDARLSQLGVEIEKMRASAEAGAAAEEARIKAAAEEDARKIVESAEREIAAAAKSARRELKAYAADLAVSMAIKQIKVDSVTDQGLIRNFANQLSRTEPDGAGPNGGKGGH